MATDILISLHHVRPLFMSIADLESEIRDRINARRLQHDLLQRSEDWNKLCSALDVIGDTELGLAAYMSHPAVTDTGLSYLYVYGALQLLQTQQDAVEQVCRALGLKPHASPKIPEVREVRSNAVGHPPAQRMDNVVKSNFIVRASLCPDSFTLLTVFSDDRPFVQRTVSIPALIQQQAAALHDTLSEIISILDEAEMKHREQFQDKKLVECFPPALGYYFSKIFEALHNPAYFPLGSGHVDLVGQCVEKLRSMLEHRGEWGVHDSLTYEFELLQYPLTELKNFFVCKEASKFNERDMYIFCAFLKEQCKVLRTIAIDIDREYASATSQPAL